MFSAFDSPKLLLNWANHHIKEIKADTQAFAENHPYEFFSDFDAETREYLHKVRITKPLPVEIPLLAFDAVNALRAVLDQTIFASGLTLLGRAPKDTKFPFGTNEDAARKNGLGGSEADPEIIETALRFKPYATDDDLRRESGLLHRLNKLRNLKHHRILAPIAVASSHVAIKGGTYIYSGGPSILTIPHSNWDTSKNELTYLRGARPDPNAQVKITVDVVFGQETPLPQINALRFFLAVSREVQSVLTAVEAETARILAMRRANQKP